MADGKLTDRAVRTLKERGRYGDGNTLYLVVTPGGSKQWVQRLTIGGKSTDLGLGGYPLVSLKEARENAQANRKLARRGIDPLETKREKRERADSTVTFCEAAERVIALRRPTWKNAKHAAQWGSTLRTYAFPAIGNVSVVDVTSFDVLKLLEPIWTAKPETARRVRQRVKTILDWAVAQGLRSDNPAGESLNVVLPRLPRTKAHHPALHYSKVAGAISQVYKSDAEPVTKLAFEFLVLTATRSNNVRGAEWREVEMASRTWTIPATRMKGTEESAKDHRVPLSDRAMEVLAEARAFSSGSELIFPGPHSGRPLSDSTHSAQLRGLGIPAVPHGFRSSFKDWCIEETDTPWAVGEAALAHTLGNSTEVAYARSDLFDKRRVLMDAWAAYLTV
jgi:integrase